MLRLTLFIILLSFSLLAQENRKGNISLTFNGEKIDLPIKTVLMNKEEKIQVSVRAEKNNEEIQQIIALDITFDQLLTTEAQSEDYFKLEVRTTKKVKLKKGINKSGKELFVALAKEKQVCRFELYHGFERVNWETQSFQITMNITKINFINNHINIIGEFSVILRSGLDGFYTKEVVKIEDGRFEIIL